MQSNSKNWMLDFLSKPFPLLDDFRSKLFLVLFCGFFSAFFILFYNPFNLNEISYDTAIGKFLAIWSAGILGAVFLSFTQFFIRPRTPFAHPNVGEFLLWVILEMLLLGGGIFIIFSEPKEPFLKEFLQILEYTCSLAILPYILACLLIAVFKLSERVRQVENQPKAKLEGHSFKDENGKVVLIIRPEQILFLKSENNYTSIFYTHNEQVQRKLIRNNLKNLEAELVDYSYLTRIHRSYMLNLHNVVSVQRQKRGFQVQLDLLPETYFKVSEKYKPVFEAKIK